MKKLILSLLIFCSAFATAQISIPQVTGLPAALNSKVDKATGKSLVADTLSAKIQPHVTNTANPHSTTKAQVGLGNVDNTSDINKPISSATQTALNGKQPTGTYSTDIHSNITALNAVGGVNNGDETLTSIKTKLGAASAVSDGYLTYNMFNIFNSKEPSFSKNTAFNKNFGTTTGTVLEGRTFGTAANSAVGDFIQNQNSSPQSANMWINGSVTNNFLNIKSGLVNADFEHIRFSRNDDYRYNSIHNTSFPGTGSLMDFYVHNGVGDATQVKVLSLNGAGLATFASTVNATGFLLNGNNLTSSLSPNYLPKWNGSSMVNSLISDNGSDILISGVQPFFKGGSSTGRFIVGNDNTTAYSIAYGSSHSTDPSVYEISSSKTKFFTNSSERLRISNTGEISIFSTTPSTSPTTGALVVGGGIGVGGNSYFNGNIGIGGNSGLSNPRLILNTTSYRWLTQGVGGNYQINVDGVAGSVLSITASNGNTGIGYTADQGYKLSVNGSGYFNGNVTASGEITAYSSSDIRLKENIQPLNKSLELINKLNPVQYNWNDKAKELNKNKDDKTDVGVIAQELKEVLPNLVHGIYNDEFLSVDYVKLIPYLIGAIQELTTEINTLKNK